MLATNLQFRAPPAQNEPQFKQEALQFLANFRQMPDVLVSLRTEFIGPQEPVYLITEFDNGEFKLYSVDIPRVNSNNIALTDEERNAIIDAIPTNETFVSINRGFTFEANEDESEITVRLGEEWLFAILIDLDTETYMIERNQYLVRDSDISAMIKTVGLAFRLARDEI
jgi:hypothetical protein